MRESAGSRKPVLGLLRGLLCAAALGLPALGAHASVVLTTLHSFQVFTNGAYPEAGRAGPSFKVSCRSNHTSPKPPSPGFFSKVHLVPGRTCWRAGPQPKNWFGIRRNLPLGFLHIRRRVQAAQTALADFTNFDRLLEAL